jgi:hypothetical protein
VVLDMVSTNCRDLIVLSWRAFVIKQYIIDKKIIDSIDSNQINITNIDIYLELSTLYNHLKTVLNHN